jgi:hypothetical protein
VETALSGILEHDAEKWSPVFAGADLRFGDIMLQLVEIDHVHEFGLTQPKLIVI